MQVLIADDETVTRAMLGAALERSGYQVIAVDDGQKALDALRTGDCQLVVSDWEMPRLTGIELCKAVRSDALDRYVYFIMLTVHDRPQDVLAGMEAGVDDFVTKPFNPPEIVGRVRAGERILALDSAEMTIFALARLAESRDPETGAHLERVRSYCRTLAKQLQKHPKYVSQIDDGFVRLIYQTSPLHDIGKVAIPDSVLLKPGQLNDKEYELMKLHATQGAATLEAAAAKYPNARFLRMAHDIALTHHEKYDGSGYPHGLAGEAIPLSGRITALADVYDALTSARVYKAAFGHHVAKSIIEEERGRHFDPDVVDAFLAAEAEFVAIRDEFNDERSAQAA